MKGENRDDLLVGPAPQIRIFVVTALDKTDVGPTWVGVLNVGR